LEATEYQFANFLGDIAVFKRYLCFVRGHCHPQYVVWKK